MTQFNVQVADPAAIESYARPFTRIGPNGEKQVKVHSSGKVFLKNSEGMMVLSSLRKDEWEMLDAAVMRAARLKQTIVGDLRGRGLVKPIPFEVVVSQWNTASEVTAAEESITGESRGNRGQVDFSLAGVVVPVIFKEFTIPRRVLLSSRRLGEGIDTVTAFEAGLAVAEKRESIVVDGSSVRLGSNVVYGLTNHASILTDTAGNYGGGDWGTASNITPTIVGMLNAVQATSNRFMGPFMCYIARTQYNQAALAFPSTDNNSTYVDRIKSLAAIEDVKPADFLAAGEVMLVQMTENVVDMVEANDIQMVEWSSGDGMTSHFKVMAVAAPRVKADYAGRSGIVLATGA